MENIFKACNNGGMSMIAVGRYIQTYRRSASLSQEELGATVGVTGRTVSEWESGRSLPDLRAMAQIMDALGGYIEEAKALLLNPSANEKDGEALAKKRIAASGQTIQAQEDAIIAAADTDEKRAVLLRRIAELTTDPSLRDRIAGYLDALEQL